MSTPRVTELPLPAERVERDGFADDPFTRPRRPRMEPYDRAAQRAMVRASIMATDLHTHSYDREGTR